MTSAQHLIIAARTKLVPIEIFVRGRWVVVEMTDNRAVIDRKFKVLQRFSQLSQSRGRPPVEIVVFASEKADIGQVSVLGLEAVEAPPKLATVFATNKSVRHAFWKNVFNKLGEPFDPPVMHYDAIAAERLFKTEVENVRQAKRKHVWTHISYLGAAVAALVMIGFSGAWFIETLNASRALTGTEAQMAEDDPTEPGVTKSERMSSLAAYFSDR